MKRWRIFVCFFTAVQAQLLSKASSVKSNCSTGHKNVFGHCVLDVKCPPAQVFARAPSLGCKKPRDPLNKAPSGIEPWFTAELFNDLFPKANLGLGPNPCLPYSHEAFIIAARYFPQFGTESPMSLTQPSNPATADEGLSPDQHHKRDVAAFFAHAIQETGENDPSLYIQFDKEKADACFYRGGLFNWFEGGPISPFLAPGKQGSSPSDGEWCQSAGRYCVSGAEYDNIFPCNPDVVKSGESTLFKGCYFGRGAVQISYNFNYGQFQEWLNDQGLGSKVDVLKEPNLVMTSMNPPLALMASLWFYMTPQPPKPAIHDIIVGNWEPGQKNRMAGYQGAIFGPSSLIINNECNGEDPAEPGGAGESRRIKAFKWFCRYFGVPDTPPTGKSVVSTLSCKGMPQPLGQIPVNQSWQPDWKTTWKEQKCDCAPAPYGGMLPYFQPGHYLDRFVKKNEANHKKCIDRIYKSPSLFNLDPATSACLNHK